MDIENRSDLEVLLTAFYRSAFKDPLLGPIFVETAKLDLDAHLPVITDFWETVLFRTGTYKGGAFDVHRRLNEMTPLRVAEFQRWLQIWEATVETHFAGPNADTAIRQARRFAAAFARRLNDQGDPASPVFITRRPTETGTDAPSS